MDGNPHLYVFYTTAGQEDEVVHLLHREGLIEEPEGERIPASMECVFVPKASFYFRRHGTDQMVEKNLYPSYTFFQTTDPRSFYIRLWDKHFFSLYGKKIKMLKTGQDLSNFHGSPEEWANCMGRISDEEERDVLAYCGLRRDDEKNIVRKNTFISSEDEEKLRRAGVDVDGFVRMITSASPSSPANSKNGGKHSVDFFNARLSRGIKVVKKGTVQRDKTNSRIIVLDGPLMGMEKYFIRVDAHKKFAILRTEFMHTETKITMPLEILGTVEVDDVFK